jgi:hypothetical protein
LRFELRKLAQHVRHLAQQVARWARLQPSYFEKKALACSSQMDVSVEICMCAMVSLHRDHR